MGQAIVPRVVGRLGGRSAAVTSQAWVCDESQFTRRSICDRRTAVRASPSARSEAPPRCSEHPFAPGQSAPRSTAPVRRDPIPGGSDPAWRDARSRPKGRGQAQMPPVEAPPSNSSVQGRNVPRDRIPTDRCTDHLPHQAGPNHPERPVSRDRICPDRCTNHQSQLAGPCGMMRVLPSEPGSPPCPCPSPDAG